MKIKRFFQTGLIILILTFISCASTSSREVRSQIKFGVEAASYGAWKEAEFRWEKAYKIDPENIPALNNLGVAAMKKGDFSKAKEYFEKALKLSPKNRTVKHNLKILKKYLRDKESSTNK